MVSLPFVCYVLLFLAECPFLPVLTFQRNSGFSSTPQRSSLLDEAIKIVESEKTDIKDIVNIAVRGINAFRNFRKKSTTSPSPLENSGKLTTPISTVTSDSSALAQNESEITQIVTNTNSQDISPEITEAVNVNTNPTESEFPRHIEHETDNPFATLLKNGNVLQLFSAISKPIQKGKMSEEDFISIILTVATALTSNEPQNVPMTTTPSPNTTSKQVEGKNPNRFILEVIKTEDGAYINDTFIPRSTLNLVSQFKPELAKYFAYHKTGYEMVADNEVESSEKEDDDMGEVIKYLENNYETNDRVASQKYVGNVANSCLNRNFSAVYLFYSLVIVVFKFTVSNI